MLYGMDGRNAAGAVLPPPERFSLTQAIGQFAVSYVGVYGVWDLANLAVAGAREIIATHPADTIFTGMLTVGLGFPLMYWHFDRIRTAAQAHAKSLGTVAKRTVQGLGLASLGWGAWRLRELAYQKSALFFGAAALGCSWLPWLRDINFSDWLSRFKVQSPVTTE